MIAYINLGSGSYFLQLLIAGLLSFLLYAKVFWAKISGFIRKLFRRRRNPADRSPR